jgi:hypothetical protein
MQFTLMICEKSLCDWVRNLPKEQEKAVVLAGKA